MEISRVLAHLRQELDRINAAILSLERLQAKDKRRGILPMTPRQMRRIRPATRRKNTASRTKRRGRIDP